MMIHWVGEFGLVIPRKTGIRWHQQTSGVMCSQVEIEGIFIPLDEPQEWDEKNQKWIKLLEGLTAANYTYAYKQIASIWKRINLKLGFGYKGVDEPAGQPWTQEGIKWIKITKLKYPKKRGRAKINDIIHKRECKELEDEYKDLIGKTICLIYPNCD